MPLEPEALDAVPRSSLALDRLLLVRSGAVIAFNPDSRTSSKPSAARDVPLVPAPTLVMDGCPLRSPRCR
ncbi:MAG: hypothetical protein R3F43_13205 [bacterium]